ncbi:hypothetical protein [uncultured Hyphomicrobium sp.]|uniref:hypothetical protein n=1 Tax=uncultured Hyphomicrobium sp. TaxID=194373 RepID=UPI0025F67017|nr:hypothetical protein [uncultured Hyphomicrobium sp.]
MNDDALGKALDAWAGKAEFGPRAKEHQRLNSRATPTDDGLAQLNFKVSPSMKSRIKQLAARDRITLLAMLYHMVDLYESKHGPLASK